MSKKKKNRNKNSYAKSFVKPEKVKAEEQIWPEEPNLQEEENAGAVSEEGSAEENGEVFAEVTEAESTADISEEEFSEEPEEEFTEGAEEFSEEPEEEFTEEPEEFSEEPEEEFTEGAEEFSEEPEERFTEGPEEFSEEAAESEKETDEISSEGEELTRKNEEEDTHENRQTISEEVFFDSEEDKSGAAPEAHYCEKAREEFEEAQRKQAVKAKQARLEDPEKEKEKDDRRQFRRKRRIRNQIIAYLAVFIFLVIVVGGGYYLIQTYVIDTGLFSKKQEYVAPGEKEDASALKDTDKQVVSGEDQEISDQVGEGPGTGENTSSEQVTEEPVAEEPVTEGTVSDGTEGTTEEISPDEALDAYIDSIISGMTIDQKVAGIIMTSPEALTKVNLATMAGDGTRTALADYPVGGLIYDKRNVTAHDQFRDMITGTVGMVSSPTFFAIAEEGGPVNSPLANAGFYEQVGSPAAVIETNDVANAYNAGLAIGTALSELGINVNLAPVADLSSNVDEPLDGRTYGTSAMDSIGYVSMFEDGLEAGGVTSCLKFFPGQGFSSGDPIYGRVVINKSEEDYRKGDFLVYQAMIENGTKMIEICNCVVSAFDDTVPATLSENIVTGILRNELGFDGVVLSGNLSDKAIMDYYGADEAAILALKAGCDMVVNPYEFETAYNGIIKAVGDGVVSEERINDSLKRIYRIKYAGSV